MFLKHSYLTKGMVELVQEGFKRLSGGLGGKPVFRLKQAMGGGKTHLIKTMAFLARHEPLRSEFFSEAASHRIPQILRGSEYFSKPIHRGV